MIIPFRSKYSSRKKSWFFRQNNTFLGNNWSHISLYDEQNDARHIDWKKSFSHQIFEKKFEDTGHIRLIFCFEKNLWDEFFIENPKLSRKKWKENSKKILEKNAKYLQIPFESIDFSYFEELEEIFHKKNFQKHLVILFKEHFHENEYKILEKIAKKNEFLSIRSYHPFEKNPHENILFFWKILSKKQQKNYLETLKNEEKTLEKKLQKLEIPLICTDTTTSIDITLNNFFRYHYE